jgi:hypothetical protein
MMAGVRATEGFMRLIIATFVGLVACVLYAATPAAALSTGDVVGTWKLVSDVRQAVGSDKVVNNLGENPTGILIITPDNRVCTTPEDAHRLRGLRQLRA